MGRYYLNKKEEADSCQNLDVYWLNKNGYFPSTKDKNFYKSGKVTWKWGDRETGNIDIAVEKSPQSGFYIRFRYTSTTTSTGEKSSMDYKFKILTTRCNLGGERYWFQCGLSSDGVFCGRRVGKLYFAGQGKYLGCRHCYNLSYRSRNTNWHKDRVWHSYFQTDMKINELEKKIKRYFYNGKPTKNYRKLRELEYRLCGTSTEFIEYMHKQYPAIK